MRPSCLLVRRSNLTALPTQWTQRRQLLTLAIETSCDDTSVAVLEKLNDKRAFLHFHSKITSDNRAFGGVHPITAHESHQKNLANLVNQALKHLPLMPTTKKALNRELARLSRPRRQVLEEEHTTEEVSVQNSESAERQPPPFNGLLVESDNGSIYFRRKPDFITVTRGPGMRASLTTGLDTAKGLAIAWQVPLVGVNHMQAHALTPRLISAFGWVAKYGGAKSSGVESSLSTASKSKAEINTVEIGPDFPFLSLLVSGGHTMLVHSRSLCDHEILANTTDMAVGDMLDKTAREVLPRAVIESARDVMYGKLLQSFAFPRLGDLEPTYDYVPPSSFTRPRNINLQGYEWTIWPPYSTPGPGGSLKYAGDFSFSGMGSSVNRILTQRPEIDGDTRRVVAREAMVMAFEHLASRLLFALKRPDVKNIKTVVVSGGVASNQFLRVILRENLNANGHDDVELIFPPPKFCSDNAAMIAWTGMEMYEAGWRTSLDATAVKKWSIDPKAEDGGILGLDGWQRRFAVSDPLTEQNGTSSMDGIGEVLHE